MSCSITKRRTRSSSLSIWINRTETKPRVSEPLGFSVPEDAFEKHFRILLYPIHRLSNRWEFRSRPLNQTACPFVFSRKQQEASHAEDPALNNGQEASDQA